MVEVLLPPSLKDSKTRSRKLIVEKNSVELVVAELIERVPGFDTKLMADNQIHQFVKMLVNGQDIRFRNGMKTSLEKTDKLVIFHPIAGG